MRNPPYWLILQSAGSIMSPPTTIGSRERGFIGVSFCSIVDFWACFSSAAFFSACFLSFSRPSLTLDRVALLWPAARISLVVEPRSSMAVTSSCFGVQVIFLPTILRLIPVWFPFYFRLVSIIKWVLGTVKVLTYPPVAIKLKAWILRWWLPSSGREAS